MNRIGRAVEVNIDRLSNDNLVVIYYVYVTDSGDPVIEPVRLYENVSKYTLARIAALLADSENELVEGSPQEVHTYLEERNAKLN